MEELEYSFIPEAPVTKKGRLWPALFAMGIMLAIGITVFALTFSPAPGTQRDTNMPWFVISDGTLYFDAAYYTGGEELTVPLTVAGQRVTALGEECFAGISGLTTVYLPSTITAIGDGAFYGCVDLRGIMLPENLLSIGNEAFSDCYALEAICIPAGVRNVGTEVFRGCEAMNFVFYSGTDAQWESLNFDGIPEDAMIMTADNSYPHG